MLDARKTNESLNKRIHALDVTDREKELIGGVATGFTAYVGLKYLADLKSRIRDTARQEKERESLRDICTCAVMDYMVQNPDREVCRYVREQKISILDFLSRYGIVDLIFQSLLE